MSGIDPRVVTPGLMFLLTLLVWSSSAVAQVRVQGTVTWADGTPAANVRVDITAIKRSTTTDELGRYLFDGVKPGFWTMVQVSLGPRILMSSGKLISLDVEQVDFRLQGTAADPNQSPDRAVHVSRAVPTAEPRPDVTTQTSTFSAEGPPTLTTDVIVIAELPMLSPSVEAGKVQLSPEQVAVLPSLGTRDIFRALQFLPGVSSNETSSGLFVRGGTPDQNLVDYDGFTVYSVDHLFGYFSAFNMDAIDTVELSKGGYEARYGGRLSSLTEVRSRTRPDALHGNIGASLLSAEGVFEMPIRSVASFLVGVRRSFQSPLYDRILGLVNTDETRSGFAGGPPGGGPFGAQFDSQPTSSFDDMNARMDVRVSAHDQVTLSGYRGNDDLDNSRDVELPADLLSRLAERGLEAPSGLSFRDVRDFVNEGISGRWTRQWGPAIKSVLTFAHSEYTATTTRAANIAGRDGSTGEANSVRDSTIRLDVPIQFSPTRDVTIGVQRSSNRVRYELQNLQAPGLGDDGRFGNLSSSLDRDTSGDLTTWYAQGRLTAGSRLIATPGVRVTHFSLTGDQYLEPRLSATLIATDKIRLKAAWGQYHQFVSRLTREDVLQGNREFWALSDGSTIPVSSSTNVAAGATYDTGRTLVDSEIFVRRLSNLSQLAPRVTGSSDGIDLSQFFYQGSGRVRGVEALLQRKLGRHTGLASYTYSRVTYDFPDLGTFLADHDRTHELKLVDSVAMGRWTLSGTWIFSTGRPYTAPIGTETVSLPAGGPDGEERGFERVVVGDKNGARLPTYHRLDLAANYGWDLGSGRTGTLAVSAFNAYNRRNVWYKEFSTVGGEIVENNIGLMGLTLNASFTVKF
jgi:ferric enterobactin receptor